MCTVVAAITVAMSLYQGVQENNRAKDQADYTQHVAAVNSRNRENEATKVRNVGVEEENKQRRMTAELLGRQRAQLGANGVQLDSGSALNLQQDTVSLGEEDALRIRGNYADQADALDQEASNITYEGDFQSSQLKASGKSALIGGVLNAGAAAYPVASKWYTAKSSANSSFAANNPSYTKVMGV